MIITNSSDVKKISFYILTFGIKFKNIAQVAIFTKLVHKKLLERLQEKGIINNIANK